MTGPQAQHSATDKEGRWPTSAQDSGSTSHMTCLFTVKPRLLGWEFGRTEAKRPELLSIAPC